MAPHSSTLAWEIPWAEEPGRLQSRGLLGVRHDWTTSLSLFTFMHWPRKWQPTPVFLLGESQGQGSLVGCRLWGLTESDTWSDLAAAAANSAKFHCHKHFPHKQVSDNNPSHGLKLRPMCSSWDILCKDPWTNVKGYFIDYFLGTTAEGFVLSHAFLKHNKHLNILSSQLNSKKGKNKSESQGLTPSLLVCACGTRRGSWGPCLQLVSNA